MMVGGTARRSARQSRTLRGQQAGQAPPTQTVKETAAPMKPGTSRGRARSYAVHSYSRRSKSTVTRASLPEPLAEHVGRGLTHLGHDQQRGDDAEATSALSAPGTRRGRDCESAIHRVSVSDPLISNPRLSNTAGFPRDSQRELRREQTALSLCQLPDRL